MHVCIFLFLKDMKLINIKSKSGTAVVSLCIFEVIEGLCGAHRKYCGYCKKKMEQSLSINRYILMLEYM